MFGLPIGLLIKVGLALALAAAIAYGVHRIAEHYRDQGRTEIQVLWDADKAERIRLTTAMTLEWDKQRQRTEKAEAQHELERRKVQDGLADRARLVAAGVNSVRVAAAVASLLDDAARSATDAAAGTAKPDAATAAAPAAAADTGTDLGTLTIWVTQVLAIHAECRDRVSAWIAFYDGLRAVQPTGATP